MIRHILVFVLCIPAWVGCLYAMAHIMEWILDRLSPLEESGFILSMIGGIVAMLVSIVVPGFFLALGMLAWVLASCVFGLMT